MSAPFFPEIEAITYQGPDSENPLAYRFYEAERPVLGKCLRWIRSPAIARSSTAMHPPSPRHAACPMAVA